MKINIKITIKRYELDKQLDYDEETVLPSAGLASIMSLVSLGTSGWIYSDIKLGLAESTPNGYINYGLFGGTYSQAVAVYANVDITMTCSYRKNVCAALCSENPVRRAKILDNLVDDGETDWRLSECVRTSSQTYLMQHGTEYLNKFLKDQSKADDLVFINAFAYLFTIIFLVISAVFGMISAGLSVWNTASNPIEIYFNIFGLYIYNGIAFGSLLIAVSIWGIMFVSSLVNSSASIFVLSGQAETVSVSLGWSYWITLPSLLLYAESIAVLYLRNYLILKEPAQKRMEMEASAPAEILLF